MFLNSSRFVEPPPRSARESLPPKPEQRRELRFMVLEDFAGHLLRQRYPRAHVRAGGVHSVFLSTCSFFIVVFIRKHWRVYRSIMMTFP